jgi:sec-independent protein translocase protein TatC
MAVESTSVLQCVRMTTTASPDKPTSDFDPDSYRMTMGEHIEELRRRILIALAGMVVAAAFCFFYATQVFAFFCRPMIDELQRQNLNTQLFYSELSEPFMVYIKVALICAAALSAPWMLYQLWQFIAAGLYPHERKYITKYIPLSLALLIAGIAFVYYAVLPLTIRFFLTFGDGIKLPTHVGNAAHVATMPADGLPRVAVLDGDPASPLVGQYWFNKYDGRLKLFLGNGDLRVIPFGSSNLLSPHLTLPDYIDMVLTTMLTFGLCFQLPLVVLTLSKIGIVNVATLRKVRRYVYFALAVLAATMTPGDMVTAMLALMAPLILLYELGIFLSAWGAKPETDVDDNVEAE